MSKSPGVQMQNLSLLQAQDAACAQSLQAPSEPDLVQNWHLPALHPEAADPKAPSCFITKELGTASSARFPFGAHSY